MAETSFAAAGTSDARAWRKNIEYIFNRAPGYYHGYLYIFALFIRRALATTLIELADMVIAANSGFKIIP